MLCVGRIDFRRQYWVYSLLMETQMITPESVFAVTNAVAFVGWAMLIILPAWQLTERVVLSGLLPLLLAIAYSVTLGAVYFQGAPAGAGFDSLEAVSKLFSNKWGLLAGWVHYLCFDLLVGTIVHKELGNRRLLRIPCLCLTFLFGPIGWSLSRLVLLRKSAS